MHRTGQCLLVHFSHFYGISKCKMPYVVFHRHVHCNYSDTFYACSFHLVCSHISSSTVLWTIIVLVFISFTFSSMLRNDALLYSPCITKEQLSL